MVALPQRVSAPRLLLVEGEEEAVFWAGVLRILRGWQREDVQVTAVGRDSLVENVSTVAITPGFDEVRWLGISQDADESPEKAFKRIQRAVRKAGLPAPGRSWEPTVGIPSVVAFVMPDGSSEGDLEVLLQRAFSDQPAAPCIDGYFSCLKNAGIELPRQRSKAWVHAFLASLSRPDCRLGEAATRGLLPLDAPGIQSVVSLVPVTLSQE